MVARAGSWGQLYGRSSAAVNSRSGSSGRWPELCSAVGRWDPRDAPKTDPLIGKFARLVLARLAVNAVRVDLTIMDSAGLFGKAGADVIAIGLDLPAQLDHRRAKLRRRDRGHGFPGSAETGCHYRLLNRGIAALGTGDVARLPLRLERVPVAKPALELVAAGATQREQDHRDDLLELSIYTRIDGVRNSRRQ